MTSRFGGVRDAARLGLAAVCVLFNPTIAKADAVLDWNAIAVSTMLSQATVPNPFAQARFLAITQLAVFEAVNAVTGGYEPYLGTIEAPAGASADAAAIAAAHGVLKTYFPASAGALDLARANSLALIADGPGKVAGITTGEAAAAAMIWLRANDGAANAQVYVPGAVVPGEWQVTPAPGCAGVVGVLLHWRNLTPFGIANAEDFLSDPPPALTSQKYAKDYLEVKTVGSIDSTERPQDRADVARFYAAAAPGSVTSAIVRQVAVAQGRSLSENARALALMSMAVSDSLVASFASKYHYIYWRPYTAIRAGDTDDNRKTDPDTSFLPYITTPCFPSYPSNHASGTNGGLEVLRRIYGAGGHSIELTSAGMTLQYATLKAISNDVDDARVYGGIHFRFDQVAGVRLGRDVATYVYKHNLRRLNNPE